MNVKIVHIVENFQCGKLFVTVIQNLMIVFLVSGALVCSFIYLVSFGSNFLIKNLKETELMENFFVILIYRAIDTTASY